MMQKAERLNAIWGADTPRERRALVAELERERAAPATCINLTSPQIQDLAEYIALLPKADFRLLALHFCFGYSFATLEQTQGIPFAKGSVAYYQDRLAQCMALPRPVSAFWWRVATSRALEIRRNL